MQGQVDITRLPSGFKTVLKKYLPSLKMGEIWEITELQSFKFGFQLKKLEPITAVFLPQLSIPDQGPFYGRFISSDQKMNLEGGMETGGEERIRFTQMILYEENRTAPICGHT